MALVETIGVKGLGWVASPIVSRLISHGFSYVGMDVPKELSELETILLPKISLFIKALPRSSTNNIPELKPWLQRLQDAYYEAEDLLDEAEYLRVGKLVKQERRKLLVRVSSYPVVKPLTKFSHKVSRKLSFMSPQKRKFWRRLTNFRDNVKKLVEDAQIFHGLLQNLQQIATINANTPIVPVTSSLPLNEVFGRDEDRDHLVKLLQEEPKGESSKQSYSVVAVVGRGGAGKTTLAQHYSRLDELYNSNLQHDLEAIGLKIVAKLGQSPLATKAVASQLRYRRDVNEWRRTLEIADFKDSRDPLIWSFQQLEEPLQRCFLYCGVLPRGLKFSKVMLVTHWCALNHIMSNDTRIPIEEIGGEYFEKLLASFFLQPFTNKTSNTLWYTIHDNFYDLAENLSRDDCFRIEDDKAIEIPLTVRHLSISVGNIEQYVANICKLENLRSLIFLAPVEVEDSSTTLNEIFETLKKLRILEFCGGIPYKKKLPEVIGTFKYLKVLHIGFCSSIKQLRESFSNLYNLRELVMSEIMSLPRHMSNLINLQNVEFLDKNNQKGPNVPPIRNLGKMSSLHHLPEFHVKNEKGFEIQQLGQLRQLQGHLSIRGLENVQHEVEAAQAKLAEKIGLESLELDWNVCENWYENRDLDSEVINALQPPSNLKNLIIKGYAGARYPELVHCSGTPAINFLFMEKLL
ncbi:Rp1-like protein [Rhynchospora pubera]|uniref:Rp1-like protein n=1 Tax=Rhynchospora pubera TaxID=906938 RepID=A0AAV8GP76_9POAL|nr:Rp1-like protein [Rhynchospora pubera]